MLQLGSEYFKPLLFATTTDYFSLYEGFAIISIFLLFVQLAQYDVSASKQPSERRLLHPQAAFFDPQHMSFKRFRVSIASMIYHDSS